MRLDTPKAPPYVARATKRGESPVSVMPGSGELSDPARAAHADEQAETERLADLERRIAAAQAAANRTPSALAKGHQKYALLSLAWRMVIELFAGMAVGLCMGWGLDMLFGTKPWLMVIFGMLGFAAGIKTMMATARDADRMARADSTANRDPQN